MSYILEALADSEQARQQITAAPKYSLLPVAGEEMPRQRRWPYVLAGAVLLNAAVLQVWLRPALPGGLASIKVATVPQVTETLAAPGPEIASLARSEKPAVDIADITLRQAKPPQSQLERVSERRVAPPPAPPDSVSRTASVNPANDRVLLRVPKLAPKVIAERSAEASLATGVAPTPMSSISPKAMAKRGADAVVATQANPTPSPISPSPTQAVGTSESPPSQPQDMPALSIAGFIRDEGSGSMVIVNDRLVREGDEVAPGVKLEKILHDSLVFNYKGYRFNR